LLGGRHGKQAITLVPYAVKQMIVLPFPYINKGRRNVPKPCLLIGGTLHVRNPTL